MKKRLKPDIEPKLRVRRRAGFVFGGSKAASLRMDLGQFYRVLHSVFGFGCLVSFGVSFFAQRVQSTYMVESRVSILVIPNMIWGGMHHNSA